MKIILVIVFAVIGAGIAEDKGFIVGALLGWLLGADIELRKELSELRTLIDGVKRAKDRPAAAAVDAADEASASTSTQRPESVHESVISSLNPAPAAPTRQRTNEAKPAQSAPSSAWRPISPQPATEVPAVERLVDAIIRRVRSYFIDGNTLVRVGAIILFFGIGFLLKYAAEHTQVPIELRLAGVAVAAVGLLLLGWRLRVKRFDYALALQGTAVGILYIVVFAAFRLYAMLPGALAFALLVAMCALAAILAVLQNSMGFAVLGSIGGFLAPLLVSTGQGDHVVLFSYYLVLNLGIGAVAWFKAWRELNLVGFVFTFVIGVVWGVLSYESELFASTEPFLVAFFLLYVAIGVLYAARQPLRLRGYVDGTLVFGTPIVAFGLQAGMLRHDRYALAFSAAAVSALYFGLAAIVRPRRESYRLLVESFWALGVVFATLTVPPALNAQWVAATWALEGAAVFWLGCKQNRVLARAFGLFLQGAAGAALLYAIGDDFPWERAAASVWLDAMTLAAAAVFCTAVLAGKGKETAEHEKALTPVLFLWGLLCWLFGWISEIHRQAANEYELHAILLLASLTAGICSVISRRFAIGIAQTTALLLLPALLLFALADSFAVSHPAMRAGIVVWPLSFALFYWILRRHEASCRDRIAWLLHVTAAGLLLALASWEVAWSINELAGGRGSWLVVAWAVMPAVTLLYWPRLTAASAWPMEPHRRIYLADVGAGVTAFLLLWSLLTNVNLVGDPYPFPFAPLLNPFDLAQAAALLATVRWWRHCECNEVREITQHRRLGLSVFGAVTFVWLNAMLLRTLHHWAGVPFGLEPMLDSTLVQTSLSIFWTLLALAIMAFATRRSMRFLWFVGAVLMTAVVVKLFSVDLSRIGAVERIVSFIAVGALMLVIGYFAPLPPAKKQAAG